MPYEIKIHNNIKVKFAFITLILSQLFTEVSHYLEDLHSSVNIFLIRTVYDVTKSCIGERSIQRPTGVFFVVVKTQNIKFTTITVFKCTIQRC